MMTNFHNTKSIDCEHSTNNHNLNVIRTNETIVNETSKCTRSCNTELSVQRTETELSNLDGVVLSTSCVQQNLCDIGKITVDAVHPLFVSHKDVATSTDNQKYYCRQCQIHLDLIQEAVNEHFENNVHQSSDLCIYCNGNVYEYFYNDKRIIYHKCSTDENLERSNLTEIKDKRTSDTDT